MTERGGSRWLALALVLTAGVARAEATVSGSAYFDFWSMTSSRARAASLAGVTPETALKVEVDVTEKLSFSGRLCFGCHGLEVDRAHVDFTPSEHLNLQAGRIGVPFGDFSVRYDPSRRHTVSNPLIYEMGRMSYYQKSAFNLGVVPQPYVDTGVVAYGQAHLSESTQVWYGAYVVSGFKGTNDFDYQAMRTPFYTDNNKLPSGGGRVVLTVSPQAPGLFRDFSLGASGMTGRYDAAGALPYTALGVDASVRLGAVTVRGEAAINRVYLDPAAAGYRWQMIDPYYEKGGGYLELEHPIGPSLILVYRADFLRRVGMPLPDADVRLTPDSRIARYVQALQLELSRGVFAKLEYQLWAPSDFPLFHGLHVGVGGAF